MTKPIKPHPGNVRTHASTISLAMPQSTLDTRRDAATPIMAVVFVWVVDTGSPVKDASNRQPLAARSDANP